MRALEVLSQYQKAFAQYERFEPEILILRSHMPHQAAAALWSAPAC
jgi:hypothetical protein